MAEHSYGEGKLGMVCACSSIIMWLLLSSLSSTTSLTVAALTDLPEELLHEIFKQVCESRRSAFSPSAYWGKEPEFLKAVQLCLVNRRFSRIAHTLLYTHSEVGDFPPLRPSREFLRLLH